MQRALLMFQACNAWQKQVRQLPFACDVFVYALYVTLPSAVAVQRLQEAVNQCHDMFTTCFSACWYIVVFRKQRC
jgi:hypothetical protein